MKILHISSATSWRGGEAQAFYLMRGLRQKGHEVIVVAPENSPLLTRCTAVGCAPAALHIRSDADVAAFWKLRKILRSLRPHIVHAHDAHAHSAAVFATPFDGHTRLVVSRRVSYPPHTRGWGVFKYGSRVDCFIAVSRFIAEQLVSAGVNPRRVVTVRSGIVVERFQHPRDLRAWKQAVGLPPDKKLIGCVASLAPQKEQDVLLRAAYRLLPKREDVHFVLVGDGECRPQIEQLIARLGIGRHVTLTGFVEDVVPAYQALTVAVLPSSRGEGSPAAVKEAMACGIPIVAVDEPNVREIVEHGETGVLVPPRNDEALARMIEMLLNDTPLYQKIVQNARRKVPEFDIQNMIQGTEEVYTRLLGSVQSVAS